MAFENFETIKPSPSYVFDDELKKLTVRGVSEFPGEVFEYADNIEILDMSDNALTSLPDTLKDLPNLRVAFFSGNDFSELPPAIALCEKLELVGFKSCGIEKVGEGLPLNLKGLILTDNRITELPGSIGDLRHLKKLMLTGNSLTELPAELSKLRELELVRLAGNNMTGAPTWLADLPKLAWYADSENTYNSSFNTHENPPVNEFDPDSITIGLKLGENSRNVIYAAKLDDGRDIALKLLGTGITSDGSSDNETRAALIAGDHPNIVGTLGKLSDGIDGKFGLVMSLVPESYKPLGMPPDFGEFTRDTYAEDTEFSRDVVTNILRCVASALKHLHSKGIMHGDVYAHNVLFSPEGDAKLSDFGAASLYDRTLETEGWREKLDVAAYGHLIEELCERIEPSEFGDEFLNDLSGLAESCVNEESDGRPTFSDISEILINL